LRDRIAFVMEQRMPLIRTVRHEPVRKAPVEKD
jgi:hypothetical protein